MEGPLGNLLRALTFFSPCAPVCPPVSAQAVKELGLHELDDEAEFAAHAEAETHADAHADATEIESAAAAPSMGVGSPGAGFRAFRARGLVADLARVLRI